MRRPATVDPWRPRVGPIWSKRSGAQVGTSVCSRSWWIAAPDMHGVELDLPRRVELARGADLSS